MLLFHLSLTSSSYVFGAPPTSGGAELLRYNLVAMVVQWSGVAVVIVLTGPRRLIRTQRSQVAFRSLEGEAKSSR